ncbi:MAG: hypothetical protein M0R48_01575 [Candidatus Omnitrophica bacterium]|jgi:hypothetical protein|nr:hypothetical protein [Candidatus Omnitrophota bacterium]
MKKTFKILPIFVILILFAGSIWAAVGCSLNDPDRDVKRIFSESTGYKTTFVTIKEAGGEALKKQVEEKLQDKLEPVYEGLDVPYAFYTVLKGKNKIGYIHGVNQKGEFGGMQLIVATDLNGRIVNFYYQKMSSPEAGRFMNTKFTSQFSGLTLDDFIKGNISVNDPSANSRDDFRATLRGLKKNMIIFDLLFLQKQK